MEQNTKTENGTFWMDDENILKDMFATSSFSNNNYTPVKGYSTFRQKTNHYKKSIYDIDSEDEQYDETVTPQKKDRKEAKVAMGRGYVVDKFKDGLVNGDTVLDKTHKDLREVFPMAMTNELIEAKYKVSPSSTLSSSSPSSFIGQKGDKVQEAVTNELPDNYYEY